jgi:plasmid stabilization system protein ParE
VPQIVYSRRALDDLERLFHFLLEDDPAAAVDASTAIRSGIDILATHPLVGRRVAPNVHELVISFGRTGYLALYRFVPAQSQIRILGVRHQRELNYPL